MFLLWLMSMISGCAPVQAEGEFKVFLPAIAKGGPLFIARPTVISTVSLGRFVAAVAVNPTTNRIYAASQVVSTLSVIDGTTLAVTRTIDLGSESGAPQQLAVNPTTNRIYVLSRVFVPGEWYRGKLLVLDGTSHAVWATVGLGRESTGLAVNPATNQVYVTNSLDGSVSILDGDAGTVIATVTVGGYPFAVAANPMTNRIYVTRWIGTRDTVTVLDGATHAVVATIEVGNDPAAVAVNPTTNRVYVTNNRDRRSSTAGGSQCNCESHLRHH